MAHPLFLAALSALCFGSWTLIARGTGMPGPWVAVLVPLGSVIPTLALLLMGAPARSEALRAWAIPVCLLAGIVNGFGFVAYSKVALADDAGTFMSITLVLMVVIAAVGSRVFYGDTLTTSKMIGIVLAGVAIWFLSR